MNKFVLGSALISCVFFINACSNDSSKNEELNSQAKADLEAKNLKDDFEKRKAELDEEDKPHFDWPRVDYTKTVAKVDLSNDQAILSAVGKPVIEKEETGNQIGEPTTTYYFSKSLASGLDITLSRELINVKW